MKYEYETPREDQMLVMKLHPEGFIDNIDGVEFRMMNKEDVDLLIDIRLKALDKRNKNQGFNGDFKPTFEVKKAYLVL